LPQRAALDFNHSCLISTEYHRKAALVTRHVHLTLKDALEQKRMKEFMAQYKGIKTSGAETGKRAAREGDAPQPQRRKASRAR
jgi:hypothetical protein